MGDFHGGQDTAGSEQPSTNGHQDAVKSVPRSSFQLSVERLSENPSAEPEDENTTERIRAQLAAAVSSKQHSLHGELAASAFALLWDTANNPTPLSTLVNWTQQAVSIICPQKHA